jgi:acetyl-CoA acetyltransferase
VAADVNNNCSTGSTALYLARQAVAGGIVDCALALGFEKMAPGSLSSVFNDRTNPMDKFMEIMNETRGFEGSPPAAQIFGNAGVEHMEKYGTTARHFAMIGAKNHKHRCAPDARARPGRRCTHGGARCPHAWLCSSSVCLFLCLSVLGLCMCLLAC